MNRRLVLATRLLHDDLYRLAAEFLPADLERCAWSGTDSLGYFHKLLELEADWVVNLDEDAFLFRPQALHDLIDYMEQHGYAACGLPDGGMAPIRFHNPVVCNAFFNIFAMERVRPIWSNWRRVPRATHRPEYEALALPWVRSPFVFDHFERYYGAFFSLLRAGERILYLEGDTWEDRTATVLKDAQGEPFLIHAWYAREWPDPDQERRIRSVAAYARRQRDRIHAVANDTGREARLGP